jgi:hypothetical protein
LKIVIILICIKEAAQKVISIFNIRRVGGEGVVMMKRSSALAIIAATALCCPAPLSLHWSHANTPSLAVDTADARVGRPLTPLSVAGVHRRAVRRTFGVGANLGYHPVARAAAVGAVAAGAAATGAGYYGAGYGGGYGYGDETYGYGYAATAPLYDYAAPAYGYGAVAPVTGGSTVIIVTPGSAYTVPVAPGYATQPIYDYAPGYGYDYTPGYGNRGYWGPLACRVWVALKNMQFN